MEEFILQNEKPIRMGFFFGVLLIMALWEITAPRRKLTVSKTLRWTNNLGLVFFNNYIIRFLFPAAAIGVAISAKEQGYGLFNVYEVSPYIAIVASVVIMDFVIYIQHVMVHAIPMLWRLHRVHHADPDYDVTTGARFHPLEIILSMLIKFATIVVLGPPVIARPLPATDHPAVSRAVANRRVSSQSRGSTIMPPPATAAAIRARFVRLLDGGTGRRPAKTPDGPGSRPGASATGHLRLSEIGPQQMLVDTVPSTSFFYEQGLASLEPCGNDHRCLLSIRKGPQRMEYRNAAGVAEQ